MHSELRYAINHLVTKIQDMWATDAIVRTQHTKNYAKITYTTPKLGKVTHCFVVTTDCDPQYQTGDILKTRTPTSPIRNGARGNVFIDLSHIEKEGVKSMPRHPLKLAPLFPICQ